MKFAITRQISSQKVEYKQFHNLKLKVKIDMHIEQCIVVIVKYEIKNMKPLKIRFLKVG